MALAPVAANDVFTAPAGSQITLSGHLGADNGDGVDRDPDGSALGWILGPLGTGEGAMFANGEMGFLSVMQSGYVTIPVWTTTTFLTTAAGGQVLLKTDGSFTYTAAPGYSGTDSFAYTLVDGSMATAIGTVTIAVGPAPVVPVPAPVGTGLLIQGTDLGEILLGTEGIDTMQGLGGNDQISGAGGNDKLVGGGGNDVVRGEAGADNLWGGGGRDRLYGGTENDVLQGEIGADTMGGEAGHDRMTGGEGHDRMSGGSGNDSLKGDTGDDTLNGGAGRDALAGGLGADVFVLSTSSSGNADTISDWGAGDRIGLAAKALGLLAGPLPADWLAEEGAASVAHARLLRSADGLRLLLDGDAATANRLLATFSAPVELTADSFLLS